MEYIRLASQGSLDEIAKRTFIRELQRSELTRFALHAAASWLGRSWLPSPHYCLPLLFKAEENGGRQEENENKPSKPVITKRKITRNLNKKHSSLDAKKVPKEVYSSQLSFDEGRNKIKRLQENVITDKFAVVLR